MEGIYNIYKPLGLSSFAVVSRLRRLTGIKKIGHAGTLDPLAEGVLVICIGRAFTRQISDFAGAVKEYVFGIRLGIQTDTYDQEGKIIHQHPVCLSSELIRSAVNQYIGEQLQVPPMYSAVHHNGKRLYELARAGLEVERQPRRIMVHEIEVLSLAQSDYPDIVVRVLCGSGTYVRSLCHDIGQTLGCGAYATSIKRTRVGDFWMHDSLTLENFSARFAKGASNENQ